MGLLNLLKRPSFCLPETTKPIDPEFTEKLDSSFRLLQSAAADTSAAAVNAAKVLQEALDDSEDRFLFTIDAVADLIVVKDGEGRWLILNKAGQTLFDMYHGEFFMKTDAELGEMFPKLKEMFSQCLQTDSLAWDHGIATRVEEWIPKGNGYYFFDIVKTPTYNEDGSRKELIVVGRDITELRAKAKREKACFKALNSASDAIVIIDHNARIFFCNDQFVDYFKLHDYNQAVDKKISEYIEFVPGFEAVWKTIKNNQIWDGDCQNNAKVTVVPMMNGAPDPLYYICTLRCPLSRKNKYRVSGEKVSG